MHTRQ